METEYNRLLSTSKIVGAFYENVYSLVLQTLPWLNKDDGLKTSSEKVLGNLAFLDYEFSVYTHRKESERAIERLRTRRKELESIYQNMEDELRPLLALMPDKDNSWETLQEIALEWRELSGYNLLPHRIFHAIQYYFAAEAEDVSLPTLTASETVLAKLMTKEIRGRFEKGESDHTIVTAFGNEGHWLDHGFISTLRS